MRPSFSARLVNGALFDPVLYVRLLNRKESLLFDCGHFEGLANREMLCLDAVFVSHLHMDHFMGFDRVLRTVLHRTKPLYVYGPAGIENAVVSKLSSYAWNLTGDYPFCIEVHEILGDEVRTCRLHAREGFVPADVDAGPREGRTVMRTPHVCVDAVILDHNVQCLGFVAREPAHYHIRPDALSRLGYKNGPWIGLLKDNLARGLLDEELEIPAPLGRVKRAVGDLKEELVIVSKGYKIAYLTDFRASQRNIELVREIALGVDLLFIEAYYLSEREEEAYAKAHLSARQAGEIARMLGAKKVVPMHVSPRYHDRLPDIIRELNEAARAS